MNTQIFRKTFSNKSVISKFSINGVYACLTLEDKDRSNEATKVKGSTCIPYGKYVITLRKDGTIWADYCKRFKDIGQERGMLLVSNAPGSTNPIWYDSPGVNKNQFVMLHIGNNDIDTLGCPLVGTTEGKDAIYESTAAYKKIYPIIASALEKGEVVTLEIVK